MPNRSTTRKFVGFALPTGMHEKLKRSVKLYGGRLQDLATEALERELERREEAGEADVRTFVGGDV